MLSSSQSQKLEELREAGGSVMRQDFGEEESSSLFRVRREKSTRNDLAGRTGRDTRTSDGIHKSLLGDLWTGGYTCATWNPVVSQKANCMPAPFSGLIAASHTPFTQEGLLNLDAVERQAELFVEAGISGVFVGGSTGESVSLTVEERLELGKRWVDVVDGTSLQVILHVGHHCVVDAQTLAAQAEAIGADAIAAMAPSFFKPPGVPELVEFCRQIASQAPGTPFYYYDIPVLTNVHLSMPAFLEQARQAIPSLAGLKFTNPDLVQLQECVTLTEGRFNILFGCDEILLAGLLFGCPGAVGSTYNFAAPLYQRVITGLKSSDLDSAREDQATAVRLIRTLQKYGFLPASKVLMSMLGIDCGPVRTPLRNLTTREQVQLFEDLEKFVNVFNHELQPVAIG